MAQDLWDLVCTQSNCSFLLEGKWPATFVLGNEMGQEYRLLRWSYTKAAELPTLLNC